MHSQVQNKNKGHPRYHKEELELRLCRFMDVSNPLQALGCEDQGADDLMGMDM